MKMLSLRLHLFLTGQIKWWLFKGLMDLKRVVASFAVTIFDMFNTKFLLFANFFVTISCLMKSKSVLNLVVDGTYRMGYIVWSISYGVVRFVQYKNLVLTLDHEQLNDMQPMTPIKLKRNVADITRIDPVIFRYKKNFMSQFSRAMFNRKYQ